MKQIKFEWYVLNEIRPDEIGPYNIFNNWYVSEWTNKLCIDYKRKQMTFDQFCTELDHIIQWQERSRYEYEIMVYKESEKTATIVDCWSQVHPNIKQLARYVLTTYYPRLEVKKENGR